MSFDSKIKAQTHSDKVLTILDPECDGIWQGRVWDNLGWHCAWQRGSVTLYYSVYSNHYSVLIGEPGGCGGHADLSHDDVPCSKDPKEAIRLACDAALETIETEWKPIELSVAQVRLSL